MTERDVVLRERQAFADGAVCWVSECRGRTHSYPPRKTVTLDEITADAARKFPLPKVTRPRVLKDHTGPSGLAEWRVVDGCLEWRRTPQNEWKRTDNDSGSGMYINVERVKMLADLLANPNETVEDA